MGDRGVLKEMVQEFLKQLPKHITAIDYKLSHNPSRQIFDGNIFYDCLPDGFE